MQQPEPPPRLDYQQPVAPPSSPRRAWGMYCLGLLSGFAVSLVYYISLGTSVGQHSPAAPLGAVAFKIIAGDALLFVPRWKAFGLGLITSVPIAILIFLGLCFAVISLN